MEESLRVRIDKIFGSLPSPSPSSLWCLSEDEIERSTEEKVPEEEEPQFDPSSFPDIHEDDEEEEEEETSTVLQKPEDYNDEEWEIKNSIGMDLTLDMEEEEDENDKVAIAEEELFTYSNDLNDDYETEADEWEELPVSLKEREKDPRANLEAAKLRLKEDAEAVNKLNSLHVSEVAMVVCEGNESRDGDGLKPILKRKENQVNVKLQKRVRFSADIGDDDENGGGENDVVKEMSSLGENVVVPDYMQNPGKYTKYTFDSGEDDEESNRKAFMDFLNMVRKRDESVEERMVELPKIVAFVPKKKLVAGSKVENVEKVSEGRRGAIAVVNTIDESMVSAMEEDEPEKARNVTVRPGRQYRSRAMEDQEEC